MSLTYLPDWPAVGARVALARRTLNLTQAGLADRIGLERTALAKLEQGRRSISALELAALSRATDLPIDWFVAESAPVVASRRAADVRDTNIIDLRVEILVRDVAQLLELELLRPTPNKLNLSMPRDVNAAEDAAAKVRSHLDSGDGALDLIATAESLGVFPYVRELPESNADGAYVAIDGQGQLGVALVNGSRPSGRRRFTLAHEIGHHVFQDAYAVDVEASAGSETERLINAFAIHLLLPRAALTQRWRDLAGRDNPRNAAIIIGAEYRVSWTALCAHLVHVDLLDRQRGEALREAPPRRGEYAELGVEVVEELAAPTLSPSIAKAVLWGYRTYRLGLGRTLELLQGTLTEEDLPDRDEIPLAVIAGELRSAL